jgi:magnesium transporter
MLRNVTEQYSNSRPEAEATTDGPRPEPTAAPGDPQTGGPAAASVTSAIPPRCPTRTRLYRTGQLLTEGFPAEELSERLAADTEAVAWLDLHDPNQDDLGIVTEEFGLHPLAVEDAIHPHQRPKVDRYRTHLFANVYAVALDDRRRALTTGEISMFITPRALITVRKDDFDIDALIARWDLNTELINAGNQVSALVYGLLDAVVDGHYHAVEELDDAIDELQTHLFQARTNIDIRRHAYELGADLATLRRSPPEGEPAMTPLFAVIVTFGLLFVMFAALAAGLTTTLRSVTAP